MAQLLLPNGKSFEIIVCLTPIDRNMVISLRLNAVRSLKLTRVYGNHLRLSDRQLANT